MIKVAFLDRDGTLNVDNGYVHRPDQWQFVDKAIDGLKNLQNAGFALAIITNQSGIAHGLYTLEDMHTLHDYMKQQLAKAGVHIDAVAFCPHHRTGDCDCRKPKTDMAKQIEATIGAIYYPASWTIGDKTADLGFGKTLGTHTALIRSEYWNEAELTEKPDIIVHSLYDASLAIQKDFNR